MVKLFLLTTYYLSLTTFLYAVEGNEPVPEIDLSLPKPEQETLEITSPLKFPSFYIGTEVGKSELGKGYEIKFDGYPGINEAVAIHILGIEDKISIGGGIGKRFISRRSIAEIDAQAATYKVENWNKFGMINSVGSLYLGENIFKLIASECYETELIWEFGVLWGRGFWESVFAGLGISGPRYITPFIQINWVVNPSFSINISHRSKEVITTFNNLYMNQPYVIQNQNLKPEKFRYLSAARFLIRDNISIEIALKNIENTICWNGTWEFVQPVNGGKYQELEINGKLKGQKIKSELSFKYYPPWHSPYGSPEFIPIGAYYCPKVLFAGLEFCLLYDLGIGLETKHVGERFRYYGEGYVLVPIPDYWLFSFYISKKLTTYKIWGKVNNVTNSKYKIIPTMWESGRTFQVGVELTII